MGCACASPILQNRGFVRGFRFCRFCRMGEVKRNPSKHCKIIGINKPLRNFFDGLRLRFTHPTKPRPSVRSHAARGDEEILGWVELKKICFVKATSITRRQKRNLGSFFIYFLKKHLPLIPLLIENQHLLTFIF